MSLFNAIITKIFPKPEKIATGDQPVISEPIKRSEKFKEKYNKWVDSEEARVIITTIHAGFNNYMISGKADIPIGKYQGQGLSGFYIEGEAKIRDEVYSFLLDYIRERITFLNYRFYRSLYEAKERTGKIHSKEQYYFKPIPSSYELPVAQEYGNLTIEVDRVEEEVTYLKIMATTYAGFDYQKPKDFDELIGYIFGN
jgi:hypothetical protein